jgi:hypothetical protein
MTHCNPPWPFRDSKDLKDSNNKESTTTTTTSSPKDAIPRRTSVGSKESGHFNLKDEKDEKEEKDKKDRKIRKIRGRSLPEPGHLSSLQSLRSSRRWRKKCTPQFPGSLKESSGGTLGHPLS